MKVEHMIEPDKIELDEMTYKLAEVFNKGYMAGLDAAMMQIKNLRDHIPEDFEKAIVHESR